MNDHPNFYDAKSEWSLPGVKSHHKFDDAKNDCLWHVLIVTPILMMQKMIGLWHVWIVTYFFMQKVIGLYLVCKVTPSLMMQKKMIGLWHVYSHPSFYDAQNDWLLTCVNSHLNFNDANKLIKKDRSIHVHR